MTTTDFDTDVDQALLLSHDWDPACESSVCPAGNPAATHIIFYLRRPSCKCFPSSHLICQGCVDEVTSYADWPAWRCATCNAPVYGRKAEVWRIEPLP